MPPITKNKLLNKITSLYLASNSLSVIRGAIPLKSLTLAITNELPENFQLGSFINSDANLKSLDLSDSRFKYIPNYFSDFESLETLILNDTIESIGENAFNSSCLNNIVLPKKLKKIGFNGLYDIAHTDSAPIDNKALVNSTMLGPAIFSMLF